MTPSETTLVGVLLGPRVARAFRHDAGGRLVPGPVVATGGRLPSPDELGLEGQRPDWVVCGAEVPRVTVDGRSTLNPLAVKVTAAAVVRAGAVLAGPLPSEVAAVDLFAHELARQKPDLLILTQPVAGDKVKLLLAALKRRAFGPDGLPVLYNGPSGYGHAGLEGAEGCSFRSVDSVVANGKANPEPTAATLRDFVRERLARKLAAAGYPTGSFLPAGEAAGRAALRLAGSLRAFVEEGNGSAGAAGRPDVCLVVAEVDQAAVYVAARTGLEAASVNVVGTGSLDLLSPGRARPGNVGAEDWLPSWDSLARRLPHALDPVDLANLTGNALTRPWAEPEDLGEAALGGALLEELLRRLVSRWESVVLRGEAGPGRARLLVGTGFGFGRLGSPGHAAYRLVSAFEPGGVTAVAVDPWGVVLAHGGAGAGTPAPGLPPLAAVCVSPLRAEHDWRGATTDPWAIVTVERDDGRTLARRLTPGALSAIPLEPGVSACLTVEPCQPKLDFGAGPGKVWRGRVAGSTVGVLLDGRGRPLGLPEEPALRISKQRDALAAFGVGGPAMTSNEILAANRATSRATSRAGSRAADRATALLRLTRPLPVGATVAARVGDRVAADTVIARGRSNRRVLRLPAGGNFELLKKPGDPVRAGETVAAAEELFGLGLREYVAPFDGVVESVNTNRTALILAEVEDDIRALVPGVVAETSPTEVALDVQGHLLRGFFGFGAPVAGKLLAIGELYTEAEVRRRLGPEVRGKVVLAESFVLPSVLPALAGLGAAGLICGGLDFGPLWDLVSPAGRFPAGRDLPTLVVLGGFGAHRIGPDAREILAGGEGHSVYVSGPSVGRLLFAGPPFAEVVVPLG